MPQFTPLVVGVEIRGNYHAAGRCCSSTSAHAWIRLESVDRVEIVRRQVGGGAVTQQPVLVQDEDRARSPRTGYDLANGRKRRKHFAKRCALPKHVLRAIAGSRD